MDILSALKRVTTSIQAWVNEKIQKKVSALETKVDAINADYLKSADKSELEGKIATAKQEAINTVLGETIDVDFDTLQEVAEWIQSDTTNSAALINRVSSIETNIGDRIDTLEEDVAAIEGDVSDILGNLRIKYASINLMSSNWTGDGPYAHAVTIDGVTKYSRIDLHPSIEQLAELADAKVTLVTENVNGSVTVWALNEKPAKDYTIQITIIEVMPL